MQSSMELKSWCAICGGWHNQIFFRLLLLWHEAMIRFSHYTLAEENQIVLHCRLNTIQGDVSELKNDPGCSIVRQLVNLFLPKCFIKMYPDRNSNKITVIAATQILHGNLENRYGYKIMCPFKGTVCEHTNKTDAALAPKNYLKD